MKNDTSNRLYISDLDGTLLRNDACYPVTRNGS